VQRAAALLAPFVPAGKACRSAPATSPFERVLRLQRTAGNRAVVRLLARTPANPHTGLRSDSAIERYARKGVAFMRRNGDADLKSFALYLWAAASVELSAIGIPGVRPIVGQGSSAARRSSAARTGR